MKNEVVCPNCGSNGFLTTSKLIALHRFVWVTSLLLTIVCVLSVVGLVGLYFLAPFMIGANIITFVLRKTIKEDIKCSCKHCKNVWVLKGRKKTWFN